ncbi:MAG: hypothetical protein LBD86_03550 [Spirochaetaceae bacterium]|jgi:hypothetical protein|nr:hypothetical protein [Spirochaetaceae bacterium]
MLHYIFGRPGSVVLRGTAQRFWKIVGIVLIVVGNASVWAQDLVDTDELGSGLGPVDFIDNMAAPARIDTRQQIFDIGNTLGLAVRNNVEAAGNASRYFVIHRLHPPEFDKLDGDIFGLGPGAEVDRISNLRLIIQGYLQGAYAYEAADAALLAGYISIYNAVHRRDRAYFAGRYKTPLLGDLEEGKEGLSTRWDEWPGATLMLVPLKTAADGSLSAVDTSSITGNEVVDELRKEDDRGVEQRQQMVELKEREAEEAARTAAIQRDEIAREEADIAGQRRETEAERRRIEEEREATPSGASPEEEAAKQASLDEREAALAEKEAGLDAREGKVEEKKDEAKANEEFAERKAEEASAERTAISDDQREMIGAGNTPPPASPETVLGIKLVEQNSQAGTPVLIVPATGEQLKASALDAVQSRTLVSAGGKSIAVAGENGTGGIHRLIEIDPLTLETVKQSVDEIHRESLIWVEGPDVYAILNGTDGLQYIGRFNTDLLKLAQSSAAVHPFATIIFSGGRLLTQNTQGTVISLDARSLE